MWPVRSDFGWCNFCLEVSHATLICTKLTSFYHFLWPATIVVIFYFTCNYHEQVVALIYRYTKQLALSAICQHVTHHSNSWILQPGPNHGLFYWGMKCITEYQYLKILYPSFKLLKTFRYSNLKCFGASRAMRMPWSLQQVFLQMAFGISYRQCFPFLEYFEDIQRKQTKSSTINIIWDKPWIVDIVRKFQRMLSQKLTVRDKQRSLRKRSLLDLQVVEIHDIALV